MKLVEQQHGVKSPLLTKEMEKFPESLLGNPLAAPDQSLFPKIIGIVEIPVPSSPGQFIYANMRDPGEVLVLEAIGDDKIDGSGDCPPRTPKKVCCLELREQSSSRCKEAGKCFSEPAVSSSPGNRFSADSTTVTAEHAPWSVEQHRRNSPKRHASKFPLRPRVSVFSRPTTLAAMRQKPAIGNDLNHYTEWMPHDRINTKTFQWKRCWDYCFNLHEFLLDK
jgi:hypothetical protein